MQQIGRDEDSTNEDDWFYFTYGDNDANRVEMQQIFVQGSFEGCINQIYYYEDSSNVWHMYRRLFTIDTVIESTSLASATTFNNYAEADLTTPSEDIIPCLHETLYYHPYQRFFFYYYKYQKVVIVDRGFTDDTGDACSNIQTPTTFNTWSLSLSNIDYITAPAFYNDFCYMAMDNTNGFSYIYLWEATLDSAGTTFSGTNTANLTVVYTSAVNDEVRSLYGMDDVGLFFVLNGEMGYYIQKIVTTGDGTADGTATAYETSQTWQIFQARWNFDTDPRPVYVSGSDEPDVFYKATNLLTLHFNGTGTQYDFHEWPTDFGRYYAMQVRPGTCAQEDGGSEDYDYIHVNMLSIRDAEHVVCIDDSDDIYCQNSMWEEYNLEECDDGNADDDDGCSSACVIEDRWECTNTVNSTSVCTYDPCGNSFLDDTAPYDHGEECDDGNTDDGDGCSSTCTIEDCYLCTTTTTSNDTCTLACENGVVGSVWYSGGLETEV